MQQCQYFLYIESITSIAIAISITFYYLLTWGDVDKTEYYILIKHFATHGEIYLTKSH